MGRAPARSANINALRYALYAKRYAVIHWLQFFSLLIANNGKVPAQSADINAPR